MNDEDFFLNPSSWISPQSGLDNHGLLLYAFAVGVAAKTIVEIGVGAGTSTRALLKATEKTGGTVYSCDRDAACANIITQQDMLARWHFTHCKDSTFFAAMWMKRALPKADLVFIDGDHSEAGCREDFMNWANLLTPGGFIVLHDSDLFAGVARFVRSIPEDQFQVLTIPGDSGLAICRKKPWVSPWDAV